MFFAVLRVFEKNGARSYFPKCIYESKSFTEAHNQFIKQNFYRSGIYVLVLLSRRANDYDLCPVFEFPSVFIKPLYTREFRWSEDGSKCEHISYFGYSCDVKDGDPEVLYKLILEDKPLPNPVLDFGNEISTNFDPEDLI